VAAFETGCWKHERGRSRQRVVSAGWARRS
jgi:hypothetical protein